MAVKVSKLDFWTATVDDRAGGAADMLEPLSAAGASFEFVFARRTPEQAGKGLLVVAPVKGAKVVKAAQAAGFSKGEMAGVRIEGNDKPGLTARAARALADAGVSFRAMSASALGRRFVTYLALDNAADAGKAVAVLRRLG